MGNERHKVVAGEICGNELSHIREAVCILTEKVYDSCRNKECIENARVIFRECRYIRWLIRHAINVKIRSADVVNVITDIEPVPFKRGFYTVDVRFFIKVVLDFFVPDGHHSCGSKIHTVRGLVIFDLKTILFGSEGGVKIFSSHFVDNGPDRGSRLEQNNLPTAKVEVAEPIALNAKIVEECDHHHHHDEWLDAHPDDVRGMLGEDDDEPVDVGDEEDEDRHEHRRKVVEVTLGLFSIIKLVRLVQLLIPAFDFCVPSKNCVISTEEQPCELFETIEFPVDEFFPQQFFDFPGAAEEERRLRREAREEIREERREERREDRRDDRR